MKPLSQYLLEMSILDLDDDSVLDMTGTRIALTAEGANHEGELYKYINEVTPQGKVKFTIDNDGVCNILSDRNNAAALLVLKGTCDAFKPHVDSGIITGLSCAVLNATHIGEVEPQYVTPSITCSEAKFECCDSFDDITIHIDSTLAPSVRGSGVVTFMHGDHMMFRNTTVSFDNGEKRIICFNQSTVDDMRGLKSNCNKILFYDLSDASFEMIAPLFDLPAKCTVYDESKHEEVEMPVKNMKKVIAIANNSRRYRTVTNIVTTKPGKKLSDIIPLRNFPQCNQVSIQNNNVEIVFCKENTDVAKIRSFYRGYHVQRIEDFPKTADGWYVQIIKR